MVTKHRAWREPLEHSVTWFQLLLPPGACRPNLPICQEKPEIYCYVKSFHFSVIHKFLGNIVQTQKTHPQVRLGPWATRLKLLVCVSVIWGSGRLGASWRKWG